MTALTLSPRCPTCYRPLIIVPNLFSWFDVSQGNHHKLRYALIDPFHAPQDRVRLTRVINELVEPLRGPSIVLPVLRFNRVPQIVATPERDCRVVHDYVALRYILRRYHRVLILFPLPNQNARFRRHPMLSTRRNRKVRIVSRTHSTPVLLPQLLQQLHRLFFFILITFSHFRFLTIAVILLFLFLLLPFHLLLGLIYSRRRPQVSNQRKLIRLFGIAHLRRVRWEHRTVFIPLILTVFFSIFFFLFPFLSIICHLMTL